MSGVTTLYINKTNHIYDRVPDLQKRAKEEADSFEKFAVFRDYITIENAEIVNQFKSISNGICQIIDNGDFTYRKVSVKFDQLREIDNLIGQIKTSIYDLRCFLTDEQIAKFEKLIEDCNNNLTIDTINDYKVRMEKASKELEEFIGQTKIVDNIVYQLKSSIKKAKHLFTNVQVTEFEKLTDDYGSNLTLDTISEYKTKLENANKQLLEFIESLKEVNDLVNQIKTNSDKTKHLLMNDQIAEFSDLIDNCLNNLTPDAICHHKTKLVNAICSFPKLLRECAVKYQGCISARGVYTAGLKADGTVVKVGGLHGEISWKTKIWKGMGIAVIFANAYPVGLKADGTVVGGQCGSEDWRDIVAVATSWDHMVGLKADGTVVAVGRNNFNQCNIDGWRDIVAISAGGDNTIGLKADGTVITAGYNGYDPCDTGSWRDIVAISAGSCWSGKNIVGLKTDGTVIAVGYNKYRQCDTSSWRDIVAVSASGEHTVGLKTDGTVVAVGYNEYGQCDTDSWRDIVAISAGGDHTIGLKTDGTVLTIGKNWHGQCYTQDWRNIGATNKELCLQQIEEEQKREEQRRMEKQRFIEQQKRWKEQSLCQYCGSKFSGFFSKKCNSCGKAKDY